MVLTVSVERFLPQAEPDAVGGVHLGGVGQREQLRVQRVVELAGQLVGGHAHTGQQVGPADVADEERVAGEHRGGRASSARSYTTMLIDSGV